MKRILLAACLWGVAIVSVPMEVLAWTEPVEIDDISSWPRAVVSGSCIYVAEPNGTHDFNFLYSSNNGRSWSDPVQPADTFYSGSWKPDIIRTPNGFLHVVWQGQYEGLFPAQIFHQSSSDGGRHWSNRHRVFNNGEDYADYPRLASKEDTLFVAFRNIENLLVFRSFNLGRTWRDSTVVDSADQMFSTPAMLYSQNRLHIFYELNVPDEQSGTDIYYKYSDDDGLTWSQRVPISTIQIGPPYYDSQCPSAFADGNGHIVVVWRDYKYGYACVGTTDILGRISSDNGNDWNPETRLTYTQTAELANLCMFGDTILVAWGDAYPLGCDYRKISMVVSSDWGESWSQPQVITGPGANLEYQPFLIVTTERGTTYLHCLYGADVPPYGYGTYYVRNKPLYSRYMPLPPVYPVILSLKAYPNVFNSSALISYEHPQGGELELEIYNLLGQKIWSKNLNGEEGSILWDAIDDAGNPLSSGVYFAVARNENHQATIKIIYLK